jgi:hypothetical protein
MESLPPPAKETVTRLTVDGADTTTHVAGAPSESPQSPLPTTLVVLGMPYSAPLAEVTAWASDISAWTTPVGKHDVGSVVPTP